MAEGRNEETGVNGKTYTCSPEGSQRPSVTPFSGSGERQIKRLAKFSIPNMNKKKKKEEDLFIVPETHTLIRNDDTKGEKKNRKKI